MNVNCYLYVISNIYCETHYFYYYLNYFFYIYYYYYSFFLFDNIILNIYINLFLLVLFDRSTCSSIQKLNVNNSFNSYNQSIFINIYYCFLYRTYVMYMFHMHYFIYYLYSVFLMLELMSH
jgi:hypothetical protein